MIPSFLPLKFGNPEVIPIFLPLKLGNAKGMPTFLPLKVSSNASVFPASESEQC